MTVRALRRWPSEVRLSICHSSNKDCTKNNTCHYILFFLDELAPFEELQTIETRPCLLLDELLCHRREPFNGDRSHLRNYTRNYVHTACISWAGQHLMHPEQTSLCAKMSLRVTLESSTSSCQSRTPPGRQECIMMHFTGLQDI